MHTVRSVEAAVGAASQACKALGARQGDAALPAGASGSGSDISALATKRALVCVAQVVKKLEASPRRKSKWTVCEEVALLCESWARAARWEPSTAFAFNGHSANAVNGKLQQLKTILPPEIIDLPSWTPPELLRDTLARGQLLLEIADQLLQCKDGRS